MAVTVQPDTNTLAESRLVEIAEMAEFSQVHGWTCSTPDERFVNEKQHMALDMKYEKLGDGCRELVAAYRALVARCEEAAMAEHNIAEMFRHEKDIADEALERAERAERQRDEAREALDTISRWGQWQAWSSGHPNVQSFARAALAASGPDTPEDA